MCSSAAAVGTTRARPSQHSQAAEPPPPAIAPQSALSQSQSLLQQQNGNTQSLHVDHTCQRLLKSTCLSSVISGLLGGSFQSVVIFWWMIMLPRPQPVMSCSHTAVRASKALSQSLTGLDSYYRACFNVQLRLLELA